MSAFNRLYDAARDLRDSGYSGPFIGDVCRPLFDALLAIEREVFQTPEGAVTHAQVAAAMHRVGSGCDITPSEMRDALEAAYLTEQG